MRSHCRVDERRCGRGFAALSSRAVDLDIELVVCRCSTLTKTCIMTPPVNQAHYDAFVLLLLPGPLRHAVRQRFNSTKKHSSAQYTQRPTKETKQQADIVRTIYGHWAPESPYWLMSWEDAAVVSRYRSSVCSSSSPPPRRPPFYCYCIIASVTRYGCPWIIAFCAFAARVPLYCSLNYRSLIFVVHCSPLRDTHPRRSRWTNSTEFCRLCLYRFRNRYNFSAVVC